MAEYIEREATIELLRSLGSRDYRREKGTIQDAIKMVSFSEYTPAADVAPVVHGRWGTGRFNLETGNYEEQCIRCRNFSKEYGKPYCPNCGAKMDGGDSDAAD